MTSENDVWRRIPLADFGAELFEQRPRPFSQFSFSKIQTEKILFFRLLVVLACILPVTGILVSTPGEKPTLALLTFDLDDTLFPVAQVVEDANTAMIQALWNAGFTDASNDRIVQHTKMIRRKQRKLMTYTQLRKRAIQTELELLTPTGILTESFDCSTLVQQVFDCWLQARHVSAENNLFHGATDMLRQVKSTFPDVCIGAITNGRGNPLSMNNTLAPFFDFCVSGEDNGVHPERKPHPGIFKVSLSEYRKRFPNDLSKRHIWIHVGDCLANDVGASAKMGAYPIWVELDVLQQGGESTGSSTKWSTAPAKETNSRRKLKDKSRGFVREKITTLSQLPIAIENTLDKAYKDSLFGIRRKR